MVTSQLVDEGVTVRSCPPPLDERIAAGAGGGVVGGVAIGAASLVGFEADVMLVGLAAGEPGVRVPQPPGWTRFTQMDSEIIRLALANPSLIANKFAPNIVITVERAPSGDAATVYAQAHDNLINIAGAIDLAVTPVTVCGLPAERLTFRSPGMGPQSAERHLQALQVFARGGGLPYLISVTVQTTDPNNADYQRDSTRMLDGVQVLNSPASH